MEILRGSLPIAKKEHICDWCGGKIRPGTKYDRQVCKDDNLFTWKAHLRCDKVASFLMYRFDIDEMDQTQFIDACFTLLADYIHPEVDGDELWSDLISNPSRYIDELYNIYVERKNERKEKNNKIN